MNNLEKFKLLVKNKKVNKFKITFSPTYWEKNEFIIYENSKQAVENLIKKNFGEDFFKKAKEQTILFVEYNYFHFEKVTDSYSFGNIFDGINNHSFDIIGIE
jgi:hypothetical protein